MHMRNEEDRMHAAESWQDAAERTPDVFQLPKIAPQGEDGVGHFNFYDPERLLSFQWNGRYEQHVTVSQGGYGEAVKWTFDFREMWMIGVASCVKGPTIHSGNPFLDTALHFQRGCQNWIDAQELL